jgi:epoxyqueuosine reductase
LLAKTKKLAGPLLMGDSPAMDYRELTTQIKAWAGELGFQQAGITDIDLASAEARLLEWLARGFHGEMEYMVRHGTKRSRPAELIPKTVRVVNLRMDYLPPGDDPLAVLNDPGLGYISRYALGRDYHKLLRKRLQGLARCIEEVVGPFGYRVFVDSGPVLEKPLAEKAGLGWQGKHTNLIHAEAGGWFFLGEIYVDLPLPVDAPAQNHCGSCSACIEICPTRAIIAPYQLDARRCISYLTIEHHGPIPLELRPLMGNRIYGCDDCLLQCPWNRFAKPTREADFLPRQGLEGAALVELLAWSEERFLQRTEGSAIRRIGFQRWQRNIAVALGNGPASEVAIQALRQALPGAGDLAAEHIEWALERLGGSGSDKGQQDCPS